jgi:hypothetical protein
MSNFFVVSDTLWLNLDHITSIYIIPADPDNKDDSDMISIIGLDDYELDIHRNDPDFLKLRDFLRTGKYA